MPRADSAVCRRSSLSGRAVPPGPFLPFPFAFPFEAVNRRGPKRRLRWCSLMTASCHTQANACRSVESRCIGPVDDKEALTRLTGALLAALTPPAPLTLLTQLTAVAVQPAIVEQRLLQCAHYSRETCPTEPQSRALRALLLALLDSAVFRIIVRAQISQASEIPLALVLQRDSFGADLTVLLGPHVG